MNACLKCKKCACLIVLGKSNTRVLHFLSSHLTRFDDFSSPEKQLHLYIPTDKSTEWWHEVFTFCKLPVFRSLKNRNSRNCENIYGTEWNKCLQKPGVKTIQWAALLVRQRFLTCGVQQPSNIMRVIPANGSPQGTRFLHWNANFQLTYIIYWIALCVKMMLVTHRKWHQLLKF